MTFHSRTLSMYLLAVPVVLIAVVAVLLGPTVAAAGSGNPHRTVTVIAADDIAFVDISPFASFGSAQGNFTTGAHGTFGVFGAGQAAPIHTHSGTYYGVVLDGGAMNNPFGLEADPPTLPPGSFWSVPADEQHVTACLDPNRDCRFFFHADGAFDFVPVSEPTEPRSDIARSIPVSDLSFEQRRPFDDAAVVWGDPAHGPFGLITRIEAGSKSQRIKVEPAMTLVPLTGDLMMKVQNVDHDLAIGSLVEAEHNASFKLRCQSEEDCLVYVTATEAVVQR